MNKDYARVWAPAMLQMSSVNKVTFLPVAFCESYIDLQFGTLFGTNPVPQLIEEGYVGYFTAFANEQYSLKALQESVDKEVETVLVEGTANSETIPAIVEKLEEAFS